VLPFMVQVSETICMSVTFMVRFILLLFPVVAVFWLLSLLRSGVVVVVLVPVAT
jgi:hypothetical protein